MLGAKEVIYIRNLGRPVFVMEKKGGQLKRVHIHLEYCYVFILERASQFGEQPRYNVSTFSSIHGLGADKDSVLLPCAVLNAFHP